jgi:hypothetical protein
VLGGDAAIGTSSLRGRGVQNGGGVHLPADDDFGWCEAHEVGCVGLDTPFSRSWTAITARNAWASMASVMLRVPRMSSMQLKGLFGAAAG